MCDNIAHRLSFLLHFQKESTLFAGNQSRGKIVALARQLHVSYPEHLHNLAACGEVFLSPTSLIPWLHPEDTHNENEM